jgi:hypothetical protein
LKVVGVLEHKLTETLKSKMESLEDRLLILQQNRETEERLVHTLATMRILQVKFDDPRFRVRLG